MGFVIQNNWNWVMEKYRIGWLSKKQPQFILQQIFKEFIGRKLGLSQKTETKKVFIFEWKKNTNIEEGSSLIYNTITRHDWQGCNKSKKNATRVQYKWHKWDTRDKSETRVQHECNVSKKAWF